MIKTTGMFNKEWKVEFAGHQIAVINGWGVSFKSKDGPGLSHDGAKLYIDGECVDSTNVQFTSGKTPVMRGKIEEGETLSLIHI